MFKAIRETFGIETAAEKAEQKAVEEYFAALSKVHGSWNMDRPPDEEDLKAWRIAADFEHIDFPKRIADPENEPEIIINRRTIDQHLHAYACMQKYGSNLEFWGKTEKGPKGCILWTDKIDKQGYGMIHVHTQQARYSPTGSERKIYRAPHRVAYAQCKGELKSGHHIDHMCQVPNCVNPDHLQQVTGSENSRLVSVRRKHCRNGHPWTDENIKVMGNGQKKCRICYEARSKKKRKTDLPRPSERTHCPKGHPYSGDNLVIKKRKNGKTFRKCRACDIEQKRVAHEKKRMATGRA